MKKTTAAIMIIIITSITGILLFDAYQLLTGKKRSAGKIAKRSALEGTASAFSATKPDAPQIAIKHDGLADSKIVTIYIDKENENSASTGSPVILETPRPEVKDIADRDGVKAAIGGAMNSIANIVVETTSTPIASPVVDIEEPKTSDSIDLTPPTISINPENGAIVSILTPVIVIEYSDDSGEVDLMSLHIEINGKEHASLFIATKDSACYQLTPETALKPGDNVVIVRIADKAGNENIEDSIFTASVTPKSLTSPRDPTYSIAANPQLSVKFEAMVANENRGIAGIPVFFEITEGGGSLDPIKSILHTDSRGIATAFFHPDNQEGISEVKAFLPDFPGIEKLRYTVNKVWCERLDPLTCRNPTSVAVDNFENVYVTVSAHNKLYVYSESKLLKTLSGLENPISVLVDANQRIYIGNKGRKNVEVYDSALKLLYKLGSGNGEFSQPNAIAIDTDNNDVYVADSKENKIKIYDDRGRYKSSFGSYGNASGQFNFPASIAIDNTSKEIVVSDHPLIGSWMGSYQGARIQIFSMNWDLKRTFGDSGIGDGVFTRPHGVGVDKGGRIYVTDAAQGQVQVFSSTGTFIQVIKDHDNPMRVPLSVAISDNYTVFIAAYESAKIERYRVTSP